MESTVTISCGTLRGVQIGAVLHFRNIPYAQAQRFATPQTAQIWKGVRDATQHGAICPQGPSPLNAVMGEAEDLPQDEACLTLSVTAPVASAPARAVMVWLHGGAYVVGNGSCEWYRPDALAYEGDQRQLSTQRVRLPVHARRLARQSRLARSGRRAALGAREHRSVRRRSQARHRVSAAITRSVFTRPARRLADAQARAGKSVVYLYSFDHAPSGAPFGACHTSELAFVFGGEAWRNAPMLGHAEWEAIVECGRDMRRAWAGFAAGGDPSAGNGAVWPEHVPGAAPGRRFQWSAECAAANGCVG